MSASSAPSSSRSGPASQPSPESQVQSVAHPGAFMPLVQERLRKALGPARAAEVLRQALTGFRGQPIDTPQDLMELAERLIGMGGLVTAVGRSFKVQAILRGAVERT